MPLVCKQYNHQCLGVITVTLSKVWPLAGCIKQKNPVNIIEPVVSACLIFVTIYWHHTAKSTFSQDFDFCLNLQENKLAKIFVEGNIQMF